MGSGLPAKVVSAAFALALAACDAPPGSIEVLVPEDLTGWTEMRDCRFTHEHELRYIRVLADDLAVEPYAALSPEKPYPVGARMVKIEYFDKDCTELLGMTAYRKEPPGYWPEGHDWRWQNLDAERHVIEDGKVIRCVTCHEGHCTPKEQARPGRAYCDYPNCGYDLTCGEEPVGAQ